MSEKKKRNFSDIINHLPKKNYREKDILEYPESEVLLKHIDNKIKKKRDWKCLFSGGTGTGKSYSGLRLGELWYKRHFGEEMPFEHIVSNLDEAILLTKKIKRKGEFILIEEVSVSAGSRDSQTTLNKEWNRFLDICRIKQLVICMNSPHISYIDKHIRMSLDCWVDFKHVDFKRKISVGRPLWLQTSPHKDEPYKHKYENDEGEEVTQCYFKKPSDYLAKRYDESKDKFTDDMLDEIAQRMANARTKKMRDLGHKFLSKREQQTYELWIRGYDSNEGAKKLGINRKTYLNTLGRAKEKAKQPEYKENLRQIDQTSQNIPKNEQRSAD